MPIVRCAEKFVYFAHVPRCAGSSVEDYLEQRFGPLLLLDRSWLSVPEKERWSRSSPQHMPARMIGSLFPENFVSEQFTVVRHPARRLVSAFLHNRNHGKINPLIGLKTFLRRLDLADRRFHERTDNHFLPATRFADQTARVFRIEDGGDDLIAWLDGIAGASDGPRALPRVNEKSAPPPEAQLRFSERLIRKLQPELPELDRNILSLIRNIYREDYDCFGYDPFEP